MTRILDWIIPADACRWGVLTDACVDAWSLDEWWHWIQSGAPGDPLRWRTRR